MVATSTETRALKLLAFLVLLPLAGVNVYVMAVGVAGVLDPGSFGRWPGFIVALPGAIGLLVQVVFMLVARDAPRGAGIAFAVFGAVAAFVNWTLGLDLPAWVILAPFPGSILLIYAGWREARAGSAL